MNLPKLRNLFISVASILAPQLSNAQVAPDSPVSQLARHAVILEPGDGEVLASYVFGVRNSSSTEVEAEFPLVLPKDMSDFFPQQGLLPKDIKLADDGSLSVKKVFAPGTQLLAIGFKKSASGASTTLTYDVPVELIEFSVLIQQGALQVRSEQMTEGLPPMFRNDGKVGISAQNVKAGSQISIEVTGVPRGRQELWILGGLFSLALLLTAGGIGWLTKPSLKGSVELGGNV